MSSSGPTSKSSKEAYEDLRFFLNSESLQLDNFGYRLCSKLGQGAFGRVYEVDLVSSSNSNNTTSGPEPESEGGQISSSEGGHSSSKNLLNGTNKSNNLGLNRNRSSKYALKVIRHRLSASASDSKKAIDREVRILQLLSGKENVSQLIRYSEDNCNGVSCYNSNFSLLLMELADQGSLSSYLKTVRSGTRDLSPVELEHFFTEMALGVQQVHDMGVLHLDIKLCNFLVYSNNENIKFNFDKLNSKNNLNVTTRTLPTIKLADFGLACVIKELNQESLRSTEDSIKLPGRKGTIPYMSPEVVSPHVEIGKPSDIWSLGIAVYVMQYGFYPKKHAIGGDNASDSDPGKNSKFNMTTYKRNQEKMEMLFKIRDATKKIEFPLPNPPVVPTNQESVADLKDYQRLSASLIVLIKGCLEYDAAHRLNANELVNLLNTANNYYSNSNSNERVKSALRLLKHKKETATSFKFVDNLDVIGTLRTCYMGETVKKVLLEGSCSESLNSEEENSNGGTGRKGDLKEKGEKKELLINYLKDTPTSKFGGRSEKFSEEGALEESDLHLGMDKVCVIDVDVEEGLETTARCWPSSKKQTLSNLRSESSDSNDVDESSQLKNLFPIILTKRIVIIILISLVMFVGLLVIAGCCFLKPSSTTVNTTNTNTGNLNQPPASQGHGMLSRDTDTDIQDLELGGHSDPRLLLGDSVSNESFDERSLSVGEASRLNLSESELAAAESQSDSEPEMCIDVIVTSHDNHCIPDRELNLDYIDEASHNDSVSDCVIDVSSPDLDLDSASYAGSSSYGPSCALMNSLNRLPTPFRILVKTVLVVIIAGLSIISFFTFVNWLNWLVFRSKEFSDPYVLKDRCDSNKEVYGDSHLLCGSRYLELTNEVSALKNHFYYGAEGTVDPKTGMREIPKEKFDKVTKTRDRAAEILEELNTDFLDLKTEKLDEARFTTEKVREKRRGEKRHWWCDKDNLRYEVWRKMKRDSQAHGETSEKAWSRLLEIERICQFFNGAMDWLARKAKLNTCEKFFQPSIREALGLYDERILDHFFKTKTSFFKVLKHPFQTARFLLDWGIAKLKVRLALGKLKGVYRDAPVCEEGDVKMETETKAKLDGLWSESDSFFVRLLFNLTNLVVLQDLELEP